MGRAAALGPGRAAVAMVGAVREVVREVVRAVVGVVAGRAAVGGRAAAGRAAVAGRAVGAVAVAVAEWPARGRCPGCSTCWGRGRSCGLPRFR